MDRVQSLNSHFSPQLASQSDLIKTTIISEKKIAIVEMLPKNGGKFIFLEQPVIRAVSDELLRLEGERGVSVIILTGKEGTPSFATGASIPEIQGQT